MGAATRLIVALIETGGGSSRVLGRSDDPDLVEDARGIILAERREDVRQLERAPVLHVVTDEDELDDPGPAA